MAIVKSGMKIMSIPAFKNRKRNPYNAIIYGEMISAGHEVQEASVRLALGEKFDVLHLHWPQNIVYEPVTKAVYQTIRLFLIMSLLKLRGGKCVWTVHNVTAHRQAKRKLEVAFMRTISYYIDGLTVFNEFSRSELYETYSWSKNKKIGKVLHPVYQSRKTYSAQKNEENDLEFSNKSVLTIAFLGDIKPRKGLLDALCVLGHVPADSGFAFEIAGYCGEGKYLNEVTEAVVQLNEQGWEIKFENHRLEDVELENRCQKADCILVPYSNIWNSGFMHYVLGAGGRILALDSPPMKELAAEVGCHWVRLVSRLEDITSGCTKKWLTSTRSEEDLRSLNRFIDRRQAEIISSDFLAFYKEVTEL